MMEIMEPLVTLTRAEGLGMDNATLHFTDAMVNLTCGFTCLSLWLNQRKDTCLAYWGFGLLVYGTMNSLFPFAPTTPLSNSVGFSVLKAADILFWGGYRSFDRKRPIPGVLAILPLVPFSVCLLVGWLSGAWETGERLALLSYCAIAFAQVVYVLRSRTSLFGPRSISGVVVGLNIVAILVTTLMRDHWFTAQTGDSIFLLCDHLVTIVFTMAVVAMVGDRDFRTILQTAHRDPLTGTLNRSGLAAAISQGARARTLLLVDLDHFKHINDRFGHDGGDEVLRDFAGRVGGLIGPADLLARLGGEEFLIATGGSSLDEAMKLAEAVRLVARREPARVGHDAIPFTISVGAAMRSDLESLDHAIKRADQALYRAKKAGRDRVMADDGWTEGRRRQPDWGPMPLNAAIAEG